MRSRTLIYMNSQNISNIICCVASQSLFEYLHASTESRRAKKREYVRSELEVATRHSLKRIITHANETVPFYQKLWKDAGVDVGKITTPEDLQSLPLVSKFDLQKQPRRALFSKKINKASLISTSGTTATPRLILRDETAHIYNSVTVQRYFAEYGVPVGSTIIFVHSSAHTTIRYKARANENLTRRVIIGIPDLIETPSLASKLNADAVVGSPQQLEVFAQLCSIGNIRPPKVFVNIAERLDKATRQRIKKITGSNIVDVYCSSELSTLIAFDCHQHAGFHINSDYIIVEVLNSAGEQVGPGEQGEIVVTDLCNFASPMIRYRLGDIATTSSTECGCGRALPLLISQIDGRVADQIFMHDGRILSAIPLVNALQMTMPCPLTLIQESHSAFVLNCYDAAYRLPDVQVSQIRQIVSQYLGDEETTLKICFENLSETIRNSSGKIRPFLTRIPRGENIMSLSSAQVS